MGAFLKTNWKIIALFVALGLIMYLCMAMNQATDNAIAGMMTDQTMRKVRADREEYNRIIAGKDVVIAAKTGQASAAINERDAADALAAKRLDEIRKIKDCEKRAQALDIEITNRAVAEYNFRASLRIAFGEMVLAFNDKINTQAKRITKLEISNERLIRENIKLGVRMQRRLVFGPQIGYGLQGYHIGFGLTWEMIRFKSPW